MIDKRPGPDVGVLGATVVDAGQQAHDRASACLREQLFQLRNKALVTLPFSQLYDRVVFLHLTISPTPRATLSGHSSTKCLRNNKKTIQCHEARGSSRAAVEEQQKECQLCNTPT